jgi:nucleoside-diphosphate-sugar epimerase
VPRALVTGAAGLVGSHVVERLARDGWQIRALVRTPSPLTTASGVEVEQSRGDILDRDAFARAARGCDAIFHTAAAITTRGGWESYRRANVDGTTSAIEAARASGARLVHLSSVAVYGGAGRFAAGGGLTHEDTPLPPLSERAYYARSKRESEALVLAAHAAGRIWATALRPDIIYGPRDRLFVPRMGRMLSTGIAPLIGPGTNTLAVVHAANVADGVVRAATIDSAGGRAFNLANDFDITARDFFRLGGEGIGRRVRFVRVPDSLARAGMKVIQAVDVLFLGRRFAVAIAGSLDFMSRDNPFTSARARLELGWSPEVRPEVGVPAAFRWWASRSTSGA